METIKERRLSLAEIKRSISIFMYHAVIPRQDEYDCRRFHAVYVDDFACQLASLKRRFNVVSTNQFLCWLRGEDGLPRNAAILTFDDGFENIYEYAVPVAVDLKVPITIFQCSGHMDGGEWLWFSRVTAMRLRGMAGWQEFLNRYTEWSHVTIVERLDELNAPSRDDASDLESLLCDGAKTETVKSALATGLITIGAHTVNHPRLTNETESNAGREILANRIDLQERLDCPVDTFAYPEGDVNESVATQVADARYECAFAVFDHSKFEPCLSRYLIPRTGIYRGGRLYFFLKTSYPLCLRR